MSRESDAYDHFMGYDEPDDDLEDGFEICPNCMGLGTVECHCGGDLCVCENQGDKDCPTCLGEGEVTHERADRYYDNQRKWAEKLAAIRNG